MVCAQPMLWKKLLLPYSISKKPKYVILEAIP
jgi:hypothetical protein